MDCVKYVDSNTSLSSCPAARELQRLYKEFMETLDAKSIVPYLFGEELITWDVKQQISSSASTQKGNEILLDHLYVTATKESLAQFASIVSGDKVSKKVQPLGKKLQQKLRQLKECSRCVTPCCALVYIVLLPVVQYVYLGVFQCCH